MAAPDPTARLASNTPLPVVDKRLMDEGISEKVNMLCHIRKTPMVLYGIFLELTRQFYSNSDNFAGDVCATWNADPTKSEIWIDTEYVWDEETVEKRPAIYIKLSPITYASITGRHDSLYDIDLIQGEYHFTRSGTGQAMWVHIGTTKAEAVLLAGTTLDYLDAFSMIIAEDFKFETFELSQIGALEIEKESRERYKSIVTVSYSFQDTWSLKLESPKLKRLVFNAGQALLDRGIV